MGGKWGVGGGGYLFDGHVVGDADVMVIHLEEK